MGWNALLPALFAVLLVAGCLVPNRWLPPLPNDKLLHFAGFAVLTGLALPLVRGTEPTLLLLAGLFAFGWLIECLQGLVPDRRFCWRDIGANAGGIAFAAGLTYLYAAYA